MSKETDNTEQLEDLEGVVESPQLRTRTFSSPQELGEYLSFVRPKIIGVRTNSNNGKLEYILMTQGGG